jgi:diguanylate cyclase (GGDEF)-like protein
MTEKIHDYLNRLNNDPRLIEYYDLLKDIGVLNEIEVLNKDIRNLEELLDEAVVLFSKYSVMELVEYLTKKMLSKFIPSYLAFVIKEDDASVSPNVICYKNMKQIENLITVESIDPYRKFFSLSPASIKFDAFKNMLDNPKLTEVFMPIHPDLIVPMMGPEGLYGFLVFGRKIIDSDYTIDELSYIDKIMKFASISFQNNIHYRKATIDSKTKLYNHSFFIRKLDEEIARIKRYRTHLSVLMVDIDYFKKFNDAYGHLIGDRLLYYISKLITENTRKEDVAARFGGEEFVIMLVEANENIAFLVAEKIRKIIESFKISYLEKELSVTVSIGISCASIDNIIEPNELVKHADIALYCSKKHGRNRSTLYKPDMEGEE